MPNESSRPQTDARMTARTAGRNPVTPTAKAAAAAAAASVLSTLAAVGDRHDDGRLEGAAARPAARGRPSIATKKPRTKHQRMEGADAGRTRDADCLNHRRSRAARGAGSSAIAVPKTNVTAGQKSTHMRGMLS
jgi:hypothetical protein